MYCAEMNMTPKKQEDSTRLRKLLWLNHGCSIRILYGDDGEMQCNHCLIDFKREPVEEIEKKLTWPPFGTRREVNVSTKKQEEVMEYLEKEFPCEDAMIRYTFLIGDIVQAIITRYDLIDKDMPREG